LTYMPKTVFLGETNKPFRTPQFKNQTPSGPKGELR